ILENDALAAPVATRTARFVGEGVALDLHTITALGKLDRDVVRLTIGTAEETAHPVAGRRRAPAAEQRFAEHEQLAVRRVQPADECGANRAVMPRRQLVRHGRRERTPDELDARDE